MTLLQVYLPAIEGYVPEEMVQAIRAFLEFCYIARRDTHDTHSLAALDDALHRFHLHREIFRTSGVRANGFNLPRQHSLTHYVTVNSFVRMELPMAFVLPSRNQSISRL